MKVKKRYGIGTAAAIVTSDNGRVRSRSKVAAAGEYQNHEAITD
jgi:hypothetical protein